jgi:uncharacterized surface anchored protein
MGNGSIRFDNLMPGEYRLFATALPENAYIKEARLDGADVLNEPLVWRAATASATLEVVVSERGGQITGTVVDEKAEPVARTQVVIVPDRNRERADLYKTTVTDSSGHFKIGGVAPGSYKVFSWDAMEPYGWFDPKVLEVSESRGAAVSVAASAVETVQVHLIASGSAQ